MPGPGGLRGEVEPGWEELQQQFGRLAGAAPAQLCVVVRGRVVADLITGPPAFSRSSLLCLFSSGKSLTALAMARLVELGLLDYSARVTQYWPEFGQAGKEEILVCDVLRHEAGLPWLETSLPLPSLVPAALQQNSVGAVLEQQRPAWRRDGERRQYHALTRGLVCNEIFRRLHPARLTIGQWAERELAEWDLHCGLEARQQERVWPLTCQGLLRPLLVACLPASARPTDFTPWQLGRVLVDMVLNSRAERPARPAPALQDLSPRDPLVFNLPAVRAGELPSANWHGTARGAARLAGELAAGPGGSKLLGTAAWSALHAEPRPANMVFHSNLFTQGGLALFEPLDGQTEIDRRFWARREGWYGWYGFGGSAVQWHPGLQVSSVLWIV